MRFSDLLQTFQDISDKDWDLVSEHSSCYTAGQSLRTHNTGYTAGTGAVLAKLSRHCKGRMLERGVDDYLIRHTVARGKKDKSRDNTWRFEKDGVVVVLTRDVDPTDQVAVTTFFKEARENDIRGFVEQSTYDEAAEAYQELLNHLEEALDGDDRVAALERSLGAGCSRILKGIDLQTMPPNRPLLLHCAEKNYAECVSKLIEADWNPGITGSSGNTLLHLAAWAGAADIVDVLPKEVLKGLADIPNEYHEIPEFTAWSQYCQTQGKFAEQQRQKFLDIAIKTRSVRDSSGETSELTFVRSANEDLAALEVNEPSLEVPRGADPDSIVQYFASRSNFTCNALSVAFIPPGAAAKVLEPVFHAMTSNGMLRNLKLESCGLKCCEMHCLAELLRAMPQDVPQLEYLSVSYNPDIADDGCFTLSSVPQLFHIDTVHLVGIGLTATGLKQFSENLLLHVRADSQLRLRKLCIGENDFSGEAPVEDVLLDDLGSIGAFDPVVGGRGQTIEEHEEFNDGRGFRGKCRRHFHIVQFCRALSKASITFLDMKETRMQPDQLVVLSCLVPNCLTLLETFDLYGVGSIGAVERDIREMVRLCATNGKLKRLAFNQTQFPDLWQHCQASFRGSFKKGSGKGKPRHQNGSQGEQGSGTRALALGDTYHNAWVHDITRALSRKETATSIFRTKYGQVFLKDARDLLASESVRAGDAVQFQAAYNSTSRCLGLATVRCAAPQVVLEPCQDQCHMFFYRHEVNKLLVLPGRSAPYRKLAFRMDNLLTDPGPYLEERFPGSVRKGQDRFPSLEQLLEDVDVSAMADDEVRMLARLEDPDHFLAAFGRRRGVNETVRALVGRVKSQMHAVAQHFEAEERARTAPQACYPAEQRARQAVPQQSTFSSQNKATAKHGDRDAFWVFPPLVQGSLENMLEAYFLKNSVAIGQRDKSGVLTEIQPEETGTLGVAHVLSDDKRLTKTIIVIGVAESMLEHLGSAGSGAEGSLRGLSMRPAWLRRQPRWLDVGGARGDADEGWQGLFASLTEGGFQEIPRALALLLDTFDPHCPGSLHYVDKATVQECCPKLPPQSGDGKCRYSSEPVDASRSFAGRSLGLTGRGVDRHPNGRPKLNLKPRTKP